MISRNQAIDTLSYLLNAEVLDEDLERDIEDILRCIEAEQELGIHAWDMADDDWVQLHTAMRTDLPGFQDFIDRQKDIFEDHKFIPAKYEEGLIGIFDD